MDHADGPLPPRSGSPHKTPHRATAEEKGQAVTTTAWPHPTYAAFASTLGTITDPAFAASCKVLDDKCAYRMVTLGSL